MPNANTFSIGPIAALLDRYLHGCQVVIDPFARTAKRGTLTNDLNPDMPTTHHLEAQEFCAVLQAQGIQADAVLFDPPYSPRQITEVYQSIGRKVTTHDTQNARLYKEVREGLSALLRRGGVAISCGWNSAGFGTGFELLEILLVPHGGAHNDTIVMVERKTQGSLFDAE